jgi:holo-[acyl-carrier protein] synthase
VAPQTGTVSAAARGAVTLDEALPHGAVVAGIGIDLCEISRIQDAIARHGERFVARLFVPGEIRRPASSPAYAEHVAGLFAAKEAAMKALGTGLRGTAFSEIAVVRAPGGPPRLALLGRALDRARHLSVGAAHVTITHDRTTAAAVVLLLRSAPAAGTQ